MHQKFQPRGEHETIVEYVERSTPGGTNVDPNNKIVFQGFVLEHDRGVNENVTVYSEANPTPKLAIPIEIFLKLAERLEVSGWVRRPEAVRKTG
jgi:hypothetical protein